MTASKSAYTKSELSRLLRVSDRTLDRMVHTHVLGQIRVGKSLRFSRTVIDRLLTEGGEIQKRKLFAPKPQK